MSRRTAVLYPTIWLALVLLAAAEAGKGRFATAGRPASWTMPVSLAGAALATLHSVIALASRYGWDHDLAVRETARQAEDVFGVGWSGSIYVNYLFLVAWFVGGWRWQGWLWRAFVLVMVVSGAIVFARPAARPWGALLTVVLLWTWCRTFVGHNRSTLS